MAKGSRNGLAKGKKGDSVYYRISGSNNKEQQGERQYVATIKNPKTMAQAAQRVKMTPAVNFYRAFQEEILDHSFQGEKYGARCHAAFMKAALKMSVGFPFVPMGREAVAPGEYLMSRGSIPSLIYDWDDSGNLICEALSMDTHTDKFGVWCQGCIDAAHFLQNGDQITFGFVMGNEDGNEFPFVCRIVLDTTDETNTVGDVLAGAGISLNQDGIVEPQSMDNFDIEGAVIIVSRPTISQTTGTVTWQRSTETMKPNFMLGYMRQRFFSQDAYDAAMYTYMAASRNNLTSDWYLNQGKAAAKANQIPDAPVPEDMPIAIDVTYSAEWVSGSENTPWTSEDVVLPEGSDGNQFQADFSSDEELDLSLCDIKNVTTGLNVQANKILQQDGSVRVAFLLNKVQSGSQIVASYDGRILTGKITITYIDNP